MRQDGYDHLAVRDVGHVSPPPTAPARHNIHQRDGHPPRYAGEEGGPRALLRGVAIGGGPCGPHRLARRRRAPADAARRASDPRVEGDARAARGEAAVMQPGAFARLAVWSVPAFNLALWIAVATRLPPRSPVVEWPQPWAILSAVTAACAPSASTRAPSANAQAGRVGGSNDPLEVKTVLPRTGVDRTASSAIGSPSRKRSKFVRIRVCRPKPGRSIRLTCARRTRLGRACANRKRLSMGSPSPSRAGRGRGADARRGYPFLAGPAASVCTSAVVIGCPPIAQSPLFTSSMTIQTCCRSPSPSTATIASVTLLARLR